MNDEHSVHDEHQYKLTERERWLLEQGFDYMLAIAERRHKIKVEDLVSMVVAHKQRQDSLATVKKASYLSLIGIVTAAAVAAAWEAVKFNVRRWLLGGG